MRHNHYSWINLRFMKRYLLHFSLFAIAVSLLASCGEERNFLDSATPVGSGARIKVFHAAVDVPGVVVSVNDKIVSGVLTTSGTTPGLVTIGSLFPILDYAVVPAGTAKVKVTAPASGTTSEKVLSTDVSLTDGKFYTIHAIGNAGTYNFLVSEDDLSIPDPDKTYIRFINAMTTTPAAGLEFVVNNAVASTEAGLSDGKEAFVTYDQPGSTRFTIVIREAGKTAALSTLSNLNLVRGKKYTIVARGIVGNTTTAARPTIGLVNNN